MRSEPATWRPSCSTTRSPPPLRTTRPECTAPPPARTCPPTQVSPHNVRLSYTSCQEYQTHTDSSGWLIQLLHTAAVNLRWFDSCRKFVWICVYSPPATVSAILILIITTNYHLALRLSNIQQQSEMLPSPTPLPPPSPPQKMLIHNFVQLPVCCSAPNVTSEHRRLKKKKKSCRYESIICHFVM